MYEIIHMLAAHYGWSKREILEEIYPHEVPYYLQRIHRDDVQERLIQLSIVHNPNAKDPNQLVSLFKQQLEQQDHKTYFHKERMNGTDEKSLRELAYYFQFGNRKE